MARRTPGGRKFVEERRNEPVFQSLVELGQDAGDQWTLGWRCPSDAGGVGVGGVKFRTSPDSIAV